MPQYERMEQTEAAPLRAVGDSLSERIARCIERTTILGQHTLHWEKWLDAEEERLHGQLESLGVVL